MGSENKGLWLKIVLLRWFRFVGIAGGYVGENKEDGTEVNANQNSNLQRAMRAVTQRITTVEKYWPPDGGVY